MDERMARIALACQVEPGASGVAEQVAVRGPHAVLADLMARAARRPAVAGRVAPEDVPEMVAAQQSCGVRVLLPGDAEFPSQLLDLPEPPLALWVRGAADLRMSMLRSVAVVGSRACTAYGERATADLVQGLCDTGWAVVSGGAFGIDAAAHRAALLAEGATVAVLASGIDVPYPRAHDSLLFRVADTGAVVTELPPGSQPLKHRFLARNRLIAAMTRGTVVVEAARRSGAIATANRALELGRAVMAVPGPVTSMASSGTNRLLHEQAARAVADAAEVVSVILRGSDEGQLTADGSDRGGDDRPAGSNGQPGDTAGASTQADLFETAGAAAPVGLSEPAGAVLAALPSRGGRSVADLARSAGVGQAECLAHLGVLEVLGHATRGQRGWRRAR